MDLIQFARDQEEHRKHMARLRNMKSFVDTSTPSSLGLKHLATRPKKQQLIDDRQDCIAKENKKLMERMTKIMASDRPQPKHETIETGSRKMEVDRINHENRLIVQRLEGTPGVIDKAKMQRDFERHLKIGSQLRRRQMRVTDLPDESKTSKSNKNVGKGAFDADSYVSQHVSSYVNDGGNTLDITAQNNSPIKSMSEFRKHVIQQKKDNNGFIPQMKKSQMNNSNAGGFGGDNAQYEHTHNPN